MKFSLFQLPSWKKLIMILLILILVLLAIIPFWVHKISPFLFRSLEIDINVSMPIYEENKLAPPLSSLEKNTNGSMDIRLGKKCNMVKGNWVPHPRGPYYTNETKCVIDNRQNCFKFGRPDTGFLKWRWKPDECELPLFDGAQFLELVRGKSMAFVGDSVARNQMQSLICLLTNVTRPLDISSMMEESEHWFYSEYNFTVALLWTTHLVKASLNVNPYNELPSSLTLDEPDFSWAAEISTFDFVIISSGHWFLRPLTFYEKGKLVGCHICGKDQRPTELNVFYAYRTAFRTAFRTLLSLPEFRGVTFLRTITGSHVDHGENWSENGDCAWTRPFTRLEVKVDPVISEMYSTQVEELRAAEREGWRRGLKFRLLDITDPMALRPDGHPNQYGHWPHEKVRRPDCLHWCLPGPIDVWNEILLQMIKMESRRSIY